MGPSMQRSNQTSIRVICLGLGRTGTVSLTEALEILGYGPCYHTIKWMESRPSDWLKWVEQYEKGGDPELIDNILQGYSSVLDQPAANFPETLYRAYPDAKFILTTRDPKKWERSMKLTVNPLVEQVQTAVEPQEWQKSARVWNELRKKLQPELLTDDFADVLVRHNKRVEELIPASQLLVYKVEDGWEPLSEFLGVPIPDVPFPNVNNTDTFRAMLKLPALL
ncbi:hypothetical protein M422DRAFT_264375 [Sphaerobolus stellatus SS14]|uniref:Protein-tyrosine sulfotransferase n=1 Tax=Sphaerobolus stellatus (strain SS14) TaxID=990650 RepID=A0A0C9UFN8_SPHS4|nr:hypothetical protein M422DRAFT_264375 [Sphaerobolus stellatus SS14]